MDNHTANKHIKQLLDEVELLLAEAAELRWLKPRARPSTQLVERSAEDVVPRPTEDIALDPIRMEVSAAITAASHTVLRSLVELRQARARLSKAIREWNGEVTR